MVLCSPLFAGSYWVTIDPLEHNIGSDSTSICGKTGWAGRSDLVFKTLEHGAFVVTNDLKKFYLERYMPEVGAADCDVLKWWSIGQKIYAILCITVKDLFAVLAQTVSVEQTFSEDNYILTLNAIVSAPLSLLFFKTHFIKFNTTF